MKTTNHKYDYLIVGAGLFGATFAHKATLNGEHCLVIDRRPHTGGNIFCENIEGINIHKYGAHIFHTNNEEVWALVNSLVEFNRYTNCPVAKAPDGKLYNLPFNMNTFYRLWGVETPAQTQLKLEEQRQSIKDKFEIEGISSPRNLEEQALLLIGHDIFHLLIEGYTEKQWGRKCSELPPEIIKRLPVRLSFDNNYFNDKYQGIPYNGYNELIDKMLCNCEIRLNYDYFDHIDELQDIAKKIIFTGPIDRYFNYQFGHLDWRSVRFENEVLDSPNFQGNAVVNYTGKEPGYTRIIEHKHFECFGSQIYDNPKTVISREYPEEWHPGIEPYYPVNNEKNNLIVAKYKSLANVEKEKGIFFGGRLGNFAYLDMDKTIESALMLYDQLINNHD